MSGSKTACFPFTTTLDEQCCAFTMVDPANKDFTPDLSDVNLASGVGCDSPNAQFIAEGVCLGKKSELQAFFETCGRLLANK